MAKTATTAKAVANKNSTRRKKEVCKPSEIVSARPIEGRSLSLPAMKAYNLMLGVAQATGFEDRVYRITKKELRRSHESNDRLPAILKELHSIVLEMRCLSPDGKPAILLTVLLSSTIREEGNEDDGHVYFRFPPELSKAIQSSEQWSILLSQVMVNFRSLYALKLYEYGCLYHKRNEPFLWWSPEELRSAFGVPEGTYRDWTNIRQKILGPALTEVNALAEEFSVEFPEDKIQRRGRKVVRFCLVFKTKPKAELEAEKPTAALPAQTDLDLNSRALRILEEAARSHGPGSCPAIARWYKIARERGCSSVIAYAACGNWPKWIAWVAEDIVKSKGA